MSNRKKSAETFAIPPHWPVQDPARYKPLSWFKPYPDNPRTHPEHEIDVLAAILKKYGPDQDIVQDEKRIILKGHGRLRAAHKAGLTHFTFTQRFGLSEADKDAMRIADNQLPLLAGWDMSLLRPQIGALQANGYELPLLAFDRATIGWLTAGEVVDDISAEWGGMPHFENGDAKAFRSIVVHFNDQAGVDAFAKKLDYAITEKTRFIHYPEVVIKRFVKYDGDAARKRTAAKR